MKYIEIFVFVLFIIMFLLAPLAISNISASVRNDERVPSTGHFCKGEILS